jgi:CNT family concentrative nucleoside transporter
MADIRETKVVSDNHIPQSPADSSNNSFNKHEKINPVPSFDETMHKDGDADVKYNEKDLGVEGGNYSMEGEESEKQVSPMRRFMQKYLIFIHAFIWMVMTGYVPHSLLRTPAAIYRTHEIDMPRRWWIAGLILHRYDLGWLIPFLVWLFLTIRLVTLHVSTRFVTAPIKWVWMTAVYRPTHMIPEQSRLPLGAAGTIAVILVGTFASKESADNTRANRAVSLFGLVVFIFGFWITSKHRKAIIWQTVIVGMLAQFILALFVLRTKAGVSLMTTLLLFLS